MKVLTQILKELKKEIGVLEKQRDETEPLFLAWRDKAIVEIAKEKSLDKFYKEMFINLADNILYRRSMRWLEDNIRNKIKQLKIFERLDWRLNHKNNNMEITERDIWRAKSFPIENFIKVNRAGFAKCPFHSEKRPSFKVYKDNRYHCFGCQADGDVIDLVEKMENLDFLSAVRRILNK